jgi:hypothetical protein
VILATTFRGSSLYMMLRLSNKRTTRYQATDELFSVELYAVIILVNEILLAPIV